MQTPSSNPSPLSLPPAICPTKGKNPDAVPIGNSVRKCLFSKNDDDGYETPDDQPTILKNSKPLRKKK